MKTIFNILEPNKELENDFEEQKFHWGERSLSLLNQVHPDLQKIAHEVIKKSPFDLTILPSTIRTIEQQIQFVKQGKSKTFNSRHLYNCAIDFAPIIKGKITWDVKYYKIICPIWQSVADDLKIKVRLGADFKSFKDYVHVELHKSDYPNDPKRVAEINAVLKQHGLK